MDPKPSAAQPPSLRRAGDHWVGTFDAMACRCEVLAEVDDRRDARRILSIVSSEAARIERKFSRYRNDNAVHAINHAAGRRVEVDEETARLLEFADRLHQLSDGAFDITSGVLRRVWTFDGSDRVPGRDALEEVLRLVGWSRVERDAAGIRLEAGMEIDFGGIGKEYAVDRCAQLVAAELPASCLINLGGDLATTRPRRDSVPWRVGIEDPHAPAPVAKRTILLVAGALATSGDSRRFVLRDGTRYGHILDPRTGWPVERAPRSVTVAAGSCTQAGMLATLAMLHGAAAESFLKDQEVKFWIFR